MKEIQDDLHELKNEIRRHNKSLEDCNSGKKKKSKHDDSINHNESHMSLFEENTKPNKASRPRSSRGNRGPDNSRNDSSHARKSNHHNMSQ